jgi:hypothetical protein
MAYPGSQILDLVKLFITMSYEQIPYNQEIT